jgi:hypothetical protein
MSGLVASLGYASKVLAPAEAADLRKSNKTLTRKLDDTEDALIGLRSDLDEAQHARQTAIRKADEAVSAARRKADEALNGLAMARHSADEIAEKAGKRVGRGVTRNLASMPLEGIPVVGVLTIASVTALEVYDACQIMREMEGLRKLANVEGEGSGWTTKVCNTNPSGS